jgi:hypothetical protein
VHVEGGDVGEGMNRPAKRGPHELEQHPPYATVDDGVLFPHFADTMSFGAAGAVVVRAAGAVVVRGVGRCPG